MKKDLSCVYCARVVATPPKYLRSLLFFFASLLLGAIAQNALAEQPADAVRCCQCHNVMCEVNLNKTDVHPLFLQQQCYLCHVDNDSAAEKEIYNVSTSQITWLGEHFSPALEHWFIISADQVSNGKLIVSARNAMGKHYKEMLSLPALETLEVKVNDVTPPVIKSPEIIGVYQGTMVSSRIGWLTDEESDTEVRYGIDTLQYSAKADHFTTAHEIVLQNLQANQQYQYIVISRDIFGNQAESGRAFFNTEQFSPYSPVEFEQYQETEDLFDAHFFRNGDSYLVKFTAVQPVILSVGTEAGNAETGKIPVAVFVTDPDHVPLRNRSELSLSVCLKCHAGFAGTNMHPVNRHPSGKVTVPADYPTSPDGRITCISCHASHASNFQFRTIRSASKDLCIGCHEGYAPSL